MKYRIRLTDDASADLDEIYTYIARYDSLANADHVLNRLEELLESLAKNPNRGPHPPELLELGIREYREVFFKPYRIIYRTARGIIFVVLVADGRRDIQSLLRRRLLAGS